MGAKSSRQVMPPRHRARRLTDQRGLQLMAPRQLHGWQNEDGICIFSP